MKTTCALPLLLLLAPPAAGQDAEPLTQYTVVEVDGFLASFKSTYKKGAPEEDAVSVLGELVKAYKYFESKGDEAAKEEKKAKSDIVKLVARGLRARGRPLVTLSCARALGQMGDPGAANDLRKWLEGALDEKQVNPNWVEDGFKALAWIGPQDNRSLDLVLKYASTGRHLDMLVASQAMKAAYEYRHLDGKDRKEFFKKIHGYLQGLWSGWKGGDAKKRAGNEQKYNAVKEQGLKALTELAGLPPDQTFADPVKAGEWWDENKDNKWPDYVGPTFRTAVPEKKEAPAGE